LIFPLPPPSILLVLLQFYHTLIDLESQSFTNLIWLHIEVRTTTLLRDVLAHTYFVTPRRQQIQQLTQVPHSVLISSLKLIKKDITDYLVQLWAHLRGILLHIVPQRLQDAITYLLSLQGLSKAACLYLSYQMIR